MADKKISALTAASVPLAGTEVLPIVQSGSTVKVSVADLTAGRSVANKTSSVQSGVSGGSFLNLSDSGTPASRYWKGQNDVSAYGDYGLYQSTDNTGAAYTARLYFDAAGNPKVSTGNLVIGTANKGIDFSANANAPGMTSELLNDYEEGTWTPSDQSGAGLSLTVANATYTKIGRLVTANFAITYPATANATNARIGGLPFTSSSVGFSQLMAVSFCQTGVCKSGLVDTSATTFLLLDTTGNALINAQMSTLILRGTVIYEV